MKYITDKVIPRLNKSSVRDGRPIRKENFVIGKRDRTNLLTLISDVNGVAFFLASHSYIFHMLLSKQCIQFFLFYNVG